MAEPEGRRSNRTQKRKKFDDEILGDGFAKHQKLPQTGHAADLKAIKAAKKKASQAFAAANTATHDVRQQPHHYQQQLQQLQQQQQQQQHAQHQAQQQHAQQQAAEAVDAAMVGEELPPTSWPPEDDFKLIINVHQVPDLVSIKHAVKFTKQYSLRQIKERWYQLLYETHPCRIACAGIAMIAPEVKRLLTTDGLLFSATEENELRALQPVNGGPPDLTAFQTLLDKHHDAFAWVRTAAGLRTHWTRMQHYGLLSIDKSCGRLGRLIEGRPAKPNDDSTVEFGVISAQLKTSAAFAAQAESKDPVISRKIERELEGVDRKHKRKIRKLEHQIALWKSIDSLGVPNSKSAGMFDDDTLAILRSKTEQYEMRSQQILLGRATERHTVDVDLSVEERANHVSRSQCVIKLKHDRHFYLTNLGKRPTYVNAQPVLQGARCRLFTNSVIEICSVRLLFTVNDELMRALRAEL